MRNLIQSPSWVNEIDQIGYKVNKSKVNHNQIIEIEIGKALMATYER